MSTNAPPCATCGQPLRWIAESYGWGCDRCRQFYPAGQVQAAQAAPTPAPVQTPFQQQQPPQQAYAQAPVAAGGGKSNKVVFIAIGGVVLVGGIIAIVLATRGGGGGGGSRDGVIKDSFAALSAGDAEKLFKLGMDPKNLPKLMDCSESKKAKDIDFDEIGQQLQKKERRKFEKLVEKTKGAKFEVEEILTPEPEAMTDAEKKCDEEADEDDDSSSKKRKKRPEKGKNGVKIVARKGCEMSDIPCKAKVNGRDQEVKVKVKVTPDRDGAKPKTKTLKVKMAEVDGSWYLDEIRLDSSSDDDDSEGGTAGGGGGDDDDEENGAIWKEMERYADNVCACKDMDCITKAGEAWAKKATDFAKRSSKATKPSRADMEKAEKLTKRITECTKKITDEMMKKTAVDPPSPPDPPADPDDTSGGGGGGGAAPSGVVLSDPPSDMPASCKDYRASIEKAMRCPDSKVDAKMKGLFADGWNSFVRSWGMITDASMKSTVGGSCDKMVEAMNTTLRSMCR